MSLGFSYRHLYYFWVVGKEGGIARAAARLGMAVQTVSTQVRELERSLGYALLKPAGRGLVLTEAGAAAMRQAEQIFQLGEQLPARVEVDPWWPSVVSQALALPLVSPCQQGYRETRRRLKLRSQELISLWVT